MRRFLCVLPERTNLGSQPVDGQVNRPAPSHVVSVCLSTASGKKRSTNLLSTASPLALELCNCRVSHLLYSLSENPFRLISRLSAIAQAQAAVWFGSVVQVHLCGPSGSP